MVITAPNRRGSTEDDWLGRRQRNTHIGVLMKLRVDLMVNAVLVTGKSVGVSSVTYNNTSFTLICIYCALCMCLYTV